MKTSGFINVMFFILTAFLSTVFVYGEQNSENASKIRFSGIPAVGFGSDMGLGGGVIGNMYVDKENHSPYHTSLGLKFFLTTKEVHSHALSLDQVRAFGFPWRLTSRLGFYASPTQHYCGMGNNANCDEERAKIEANKIGGSSTEREEFEKRYYQNRYMLFFGEIYSRWLLWQGSAKLELMTNYRGHYYLNRDFGGSGPYPGSLFDKDFREKKNDGFLSTLELGLMLDSRDNEPAPTEGYWIETSARGGASFIGSNWDYVGTNLSARFYFPFDDDHRFILASQTIVDSIFGDLPFDAMSRIGGTLAFYDFNAIGGQYIGRGIREQLYVGRFKAVEQLEFRYTFWSFNLFKQNFDVTSVAFGDVGVTSLDYSSFGKDMSTLHTGFGGGIRLHWNKTFVVRADAGVSPSENFYPRFYLVVGNVF